LQNEQGEKAKTQVVNGGLPFFILHIILHPAFPDFLSVLSVTPW
jgi:hypothetical protein